MRNSLLSYVLPSVVVLSLAGHVRAQDINFSTTAFQDVGRPNTIATLVSIASFSSNLSSDLLASAATALSLGDVLGTFGSRLSTVTTLIDAINAADTISSVSTAATVGGIASALGNRNLSDQETALSAASTIIVQARTSAAAINPIMPPSSIQFDAAADSKVGPQIQQALAQTQELRSSLQSNLAAANDLAGQLDANAARLNAASLTASNHAIALGNALGNFIPVVAEQVYAVATQLVADSTALRELADKSQSAAVAARETAALYSTKLASLADVESAYQAAARVPLARAYWELTGKLNGGTSSFYDGTRGYGLTYTGYNFRSDGLIAPDRFIAGSLLFTNGSGTVGQNSDTLTIDLKRIVDFNGIPEVGFSSSSLSLLYYTTPYVPDACGGPDLIAIPSLGKSAAVCEGRSEAFLLIGQVHSPLTIIDILPVDPNNPYGFVISTPGTTSVPEPASLPLFLAALATLALSTPLISRRDHPVARQIFRAPASTAGRAHARLSYTFRTAASD